MAPQKESNRLQPSIFWGYVGFRDGSYFMLFREYLNKDRPQNQDHYIKYPPHNRHILLPAGTFESMMFVFPHN